MSETYEGRRILPNVRDAAERAAALTEQGLELVERINKLLDAIEAGEVGLVVKGGVLAGEHQIFIVRK